MRAYKSQCSVFKDLYKAYIQGEVEEETRTWMTEHKLECTYCRGWTNSIDENREDRIIDASLQDAIFDEAKGAIRKAKMIFSIGIVMIIFIALWMSVGLVHR